MGGKRPDQYRIDEREAGSTDYKFRPRYPEQGERHDQRFSGAMESRTERGQPIPARAPEPRSRRARRRELARQKHIHHEDATPPDSPDT